MDPQIVSTDMDTERAVRTVSRHLTVGDIDVVWTLLHKDVRRSLVEKFRAMPHAADLLAA